MDLSKSMEFFNPNDVNQTCHIIGCGSVGSTVAELLTRLGISDFHLYDFDTVEAHNLANQMFNYADIGALKTEATKRIITEINPDAKETVVLDNEGYTDQPLSGYVFLCVDNIELRKKICEANLFNGAIKGVFDFRTRLTDAQHYAADWSDMAAKQNLIKSMDFTHDEAHDATPKSACGVELGVAPTVRSICAIGVTNFINFVKGNGLKSIVIFDPFAFDIF